MQRGLAMKLAIGTALVLSAAALLIAMAALLQARSDERTHADDVGTSIGLEGLMTRREVVVRLGLPDRVFRRNPRAECWAYDGPYEVRMCFGSKRRLAWFSHNIPPDVSLIERLRKSPTGQN